MVHAHAVTSPVGARKAVQRTCDSLAAQRSGILSEADVRAALIGAEIPANERSSTRRFQEALQGSWLPV